MDNSASHPPGDKKPSPWRTVKTILSVRRNSKLAPRLTLTLSNRVCHRHIIDFQASSVTLLRLELGKIIYLLEFLSFSPHRSLFKLDHGSVRTQQTPLKEEDLPESAWRIQVSFRNLEQ